MGDVKLTNVPYLAPAAGEDAGFGLRPFSTIASKVFGDTPA
jgi:hypothetical protein